MELLGRTEEIILLAVWRLQDDAYGVSIRKELLKTTGKEWSLGSIYAPLHRLGRKGLVSTREGEPSTKRGGRRTVLYSLTKSGRKALLKVKDIQDSLWTGIPSLKTA